ncbi:hypothetical protein ACH427_04445 [Streptomyces sp. NPDC020379]|uniref:hypothetical protein n=1 Tax=Streptomyces sp. NPDC020379 TaxID=3365071 RepID=UPI0037BB68E8
MGFSLPGGIVVDDYGQLKAAPKKQTAYWVRVQNKATGEVAVTEQLGTKKGVRDRLFFADFDRGTSGPRIGAEIWRTYKTVSKRVDVYQDGVTQLAVEES